MEATQVSFAYEGEFGNGTGRRYEIVWRLHWNREGGATRPSLGGRMARWR